jgi:hypothetical protein
VLEKEEEAQMNERVVRKKEKEMSTPVKIY